MNAAPAHAVNFRAEYPKAAGRPATRLRPTPVPPATRPQQIPPPLWHWPATDEMAPLGALRSAPGAARARITATLAQWGMSDLADIAELVVSELVTNAVQALEDPDADPAVCPQGRPRLIADRVPVITVRARTDGTHLLIEVRDPAETMPETRGISPDGESGRGLLIVGELCEKHGCVPHEAGGKTVWALLKT